MPPKVMFSGQELKQKWCSFTFKTENQSKDVLYSVQCGTTYPISYTVW